MNYSLITEQSINSRYASAQDSLKELLNSPDTQKTVENIARAHYFDEEKSLRLTQLITFVILGYITIDELTRELQDALYINGGLARAITDEINTEIFASVRTDIIDAFNPLSEEEERAPEAAPAPQQTSELLTPKERMIPIMEIGVQVPVSKNEPQEVASIELPVIADEKGPVVLQQSASFFDKKEKPKEVPKKSLSPFSMFTSSSETSTTKPSVKVKVNSAPSFSWPFESKKQEQKVVHYDAAAKPITASSLAPEGLINLDALQTLSPKAVAVAEKQQAEEKSQDVAPKKFAISVTTDDSQPVSIDTHQPVPVMVGSNDMKPIDRATANHSDPILEGNVVHL